VPVRLSNRGALASAVLLPPAAAAASRAPLLHPRGVMQPTDSKLAEPAAAAEPEADGVAAGSGSGGGDKDGGPTECAFFMRTGTCAYGDRCRFAHPPDRPPPELNTRGYPKREGGEFLFVSFCFRRRRRRRRRRRCVGGPCRQAEAGGLTSPSVLVIGGNGPCGSRVSGPSLPPAAPPARSPPS
jgi:hypothetical protein